MNLLKAVARVGDLAAAAANPLGAIAQAAGSIQQGATTASDTLQLLSHALNQTQDGDLPELVEQLVIERLVEVLGPEEVLAFLADLTTDVKRIAQRQERHQQRRQRLANAVSGSISRPLPQTPVSAETPPEAVFERSAPSEPFERLVSRLLRAEEGWSDTVYPGPVTGKPHAGCGHLLTRTEIKRYPMGATVPPQVLADWFDADVTKADKRLCETYSAAALARGGPARRAVLVSAVFQLGWPKFRKFTDMRDAFERGDYDEAARQMCRNSADTGPSPWHEQTPERVDRAAQTMITGQLHLP